MKELKRKKLAGALVQALGAGVALSVVVTGAMAQQAQKVEKIEVTGSNIKRVDTETVAPVEIITREEIERTGQATVADVIRNIPANTGGSFGESFSNSFASGASGISLRGLGQKTTLVLLNGRRTAGYGFAQNLQDTFVDLNSIPTSAVERIEILKDGASALYGSDAIAGVVNVILRKDFRGMEATYTHGWLEGKNDQRANVAFGFGDLAKDRWNAFGVFDYYHRDHIRLADTEFGADRDYRGTPGGRQFGSLTAGGTWRQLTATGGLTGNFRAISECPAANVITGPQAIERGYLAPNSTQAAATNTFCTLDINGQLSALPKQDRYSFLGRFTREFSANATGYVELGLSRVENYQVFTPPFFNTTGLQQTAAGLRPFNYTADFAPGAAGNPFSTNARITGNMQDFGVRDQKTESDTIRLLTGLTYTVARWDLDSAFGWSRNKIDQDNFNRITLSGTSAVLGIPSTPQPPVPVVTSTQLNLDRPSLTPESVRNRMRADVKREATSDLKFVDTKASTEFGRLPGGPIGLAIGAEYRKEELEDRPDAIAQRGEVLGQGITATNATRNNYAGYAEVALPILRSLEAQAAVRYDHYSDFGSSTNPKVGFKFKPTNWLLVRGNWGKGFRAPTLPEISPSVATFFVQVNDPVTQQTGVQISGVFAGNPGLQPEKSESTTLGVIFEPTPDFSIGVNYYQIDWKNIVSSPSFQSIVNSGDPTRVIRDPITGGIVTVLNNYVNVNRTKTDGWDLEARYRLPINFGKWTARFNLSYVDSFEEDGVENAGSNNGSNTIPRTRARTSFDWDYRGFSATLAQNYIRHFKNSVLEGTSFTVPQDPRFQTQVYERSPSYITYDAFVKYNITKNLSVSAAAINFLNEKPPYDPGFSTTFFYDFSIFSPIGRQFRLGVQYRM